MKYTRKQYDDLIHLIDTRILRERAASMPVDEATGALFEVTRTEKDFASKYVEGDEVKLADKRFETALRRIADGATISGTSGTVDPGHPAFVELLAVRRFAELVVGGWNPGDAEDHLVEKAFPSNRPRLVRPTCDMG